MKDRLFLVKFLIGAGFAIEGHMYARTGFAAIDRAKNAIITCRRDEYLRNGASRGSAETAAANMQEGLEQDDCYLRQRDVADAEPFQGSDRLAYLGHEAEELRGGCVSKRRKPTKEDREFRHTLAAIRQSTAILRGARAIRVNLSSDEIVDISLALSFSVLCQQMSREEGYALALRFHSARNRDSESAWLKSLFYPHTADPAASEDQS